MSDGGDESYALKEGSGSGPDSGLNSSEEGCHHLGGKKNETYHVWSQTLKAAKKKKKDLKKKEMELITRHFGNANEYENAWVR
jgi:hypothetical protein